MSDKSWPIVWFDASIVVFAMFAMAGLGWLGFGVLNDNSDKRACRSRGGYVKGRGEDWRCELPAPAPAPAPAPVERAPCAESNRHPHPEN